MHLTGRGKTYLLLQGPHGPFFGLLGRKLCQTGAQVWRVSFNNGDAVFWPNRASLLRFNAPLTQWRETFAAIVAQKSITDIVLYGDTRPVHAIAIREAKALGLTVHVFEEGYLRPYWASYERDGSNGNSRLMQTDIEQMRKALHHSDVDLPEAPARWGDMRQHIFWGALYHWSVWSGAYKYPHFRPHRALNLRQEFMLYLKRFFLLPIHAAERAHASRKVQALASPYHLAILQLEHDSSFRDHSPFDTMSQFLALVVQGFANGAPDHHHLVFKAHPLEDGRVAVKSEILRLAHHHGIQDRVHFVRGGKLAVLLNHAHSAVTVNSTAGQQALWRGLPLCALGTAIYSKPQLVSSQNLTEFFRDPQKPDAKAYRDFRHYLLETSQISGGFYSSHARQELLRHIIDLMLSPTDPYDLLENQAATSPPQLRIVK